MAAVFALTIGILQVKAGADALSASLVPQQVKIVAVRKHDGWFLMENFQQMALTTPLFIPIVKNLCGQIII